MKVLVTETMYPIPDVKKRGTAPQKENGFQSGEWQEQADDDRQNIEQAVPPERTAELPTGMTTLKTPHPFPEGGRHDRLAKFPQNFYIPPTNLTIPNGVIQLI